MSQQYSIGKGGIFILMLWEQHPNLEECSPSQVPCPQNLTLKNRLYHKH